MGVNLLDQELRNAPGPEQLPMLSWSFEQPEVLWLLLLLPLLATYLWLRKKTSMVEYSHLALVRDLPASFRQRLQWLPQMLQLLALSMVIIALAKPFERVSVNSEQEEGIAIALVLDISSSMRVRMQIDGKRESRLAVARQVLRDFILGDGKEMQGRNSDILSLITFARYPRVLSPLSSSHRAVAAQVANVDTAHSHGEDGTGFGDAAALAAAQLSEYGRIYALEQDVKSKIMILLTDGENNTGQYSPMAAAAMAKEWGVKIYTISLGRRSNKNSYDAGKLRMKDVMSNADWVLQAMSDATGGIFQRAHDYDSLMKVYAEIDKLETSRLHELKYEDHEPVFHWFVLLALCAMMLASILNATWLRRLA